MNKPRPQHAEDMKRIWVANSAQRVIVSRILALVKASTFCGGAGMIWGILDSCSSQPRNNKPNLAPASLLYFRILCMFNFDISYYISCPTFLGASSTLRPPEETNIPAGFSQNQLPCLLVAPSSAVLVSHKESLGGNTKAHCLRKGNCLMMEIHVRSVV